MQKIKNGIAVEMTEAEIADRNTDVAMSEVEHAATAYIGLRQEAYPSIADQLDKIFHHGIEAWKTDIQAIKDDNPKPS
jgi:hypothetical protein